MGVTLGQNHPLIDLRLSSVKLPVAHSSGCLLTSDPAFDYGADL